MPKVFFLWYWLDHSEWDLNECVRPCGWVTIIKKLKLYDECCDQIFLNMNQIVIVSLSTGALKNRCTVAKPFVLFDAPSNVIRCSTLDSKSAGIVILQKFLDSPPILCHNQRDKVIFHFINIIWTASLVHKQRP